jgi:hypothetical protein
MLDMAPVFLLPEILRRDVRGPEGIIVELAERLASGGAR